MALAQWLLAIAVGLAHFIAMLAVRPFSLPATWALHRSWARTVCRIFDITCSLRDDGHAGRGPPPHLYVWLNQTSLAEALACPLLLPPLCTIINVEFAALPLLGWAQVLLGDVVIVRQWKAQAKRGIERAAALLRQGRPCMISLEGARTADGALQPYKKGPVVLAIRAQATLVPMLFRGGREVLPRGQWRPRPGHIELQLLDPIPTAGVGYDDREAILQRLRELALAHLSGSAPDAPLTGNRRATPG